MTLNDYLEVSGLSQSEFARECDIHRTLLRKYLIGDSKPTQENMWKIFIKSKGAVTANDFFGNTDERLVSQLKKELSKQKPITEKKEGYENAIAELYADSAYEDIEPSR